MKAVTFKVQRPAIQRGFAALPGLLTSSLVGRAAALFAVAALLLSISGSASAQFAPIPGGVTAKDLPNGLKDVGIDQKLDAQVPMNLNFTDETGQQVQLGKYFNNGRPVILTPVYYDCPMLCTQILNALDRSLNILSLNVGKDFDIVTFSFNSKETYSLAAAKKELYLKSYGRPGASEGWHFLTGNETNIKALTNSVGFNYAYDPSTNLFAHASAIILLTPGGKVSRYFYGIEYEPRDLRLGLIEASANKIGTPVDKVLLFCYHYDPATGKYSLTILRTLRLAALVTLLGIGLMMIFLRRRKKKKTGLSQTGAAAWPLALMPLFPPQASSHAAKVDAFYVFLVAITIFFTAVIFIMIAFFAVKYRQRHSGEVGRKVIPDIRLEMTWIVLPFLLTLVIFGWGAKLLFDLSSAPKGSLEVYAVGKQWMWKIQHQNGQREIDQLHIPVDTDIKMIMSTEDVIHSFFIPAFRVKADVVPGRFCTTWFHPTQTGEYHLFCAEYCGTNHSGMIGTVYVLSKEDYQAWLSRGSTEGSLAAQGQQVFQQLGCSECHKATGQNRGPRLIGVYGNPVLLDNGETVNADDNYIRESILDPKAKIVAGFQGIMPTFQGVVNEEQVVQLVAYIKSLGNEGKEPSSTIAPLPGGGDQNGPKGYPGNQPAP